MSRYHSYLNTAVAILSDYNGEVPFAITLKKFFAENKKHGSRDRKEITALCYAYFRTARLFENDTLDEKILKGLFLCSNGPNEMLRQLRPEWEDKTKLGIEEKCSIFNAQYSMLNLFPWQDELSEGIDSSKFTESFLVQPDLFLRLRPSKEEIVKNKLVDSGISFIEVSNTCLALPNASKIDAILRLDQEAVIQDLSSQKTGELLQLLKSPDSDLRSPVSVWDCCAASGGKSIMAKDILGDIELTVSDLRESILHNLKKRFAEAGIKNYKSFIANLALSDDEPRTFYYDLIIADVPCSGSGTWSRTPEQLLYFKKEKIEEYAALQKKILSNIVGSLKPDGHLLYITCSVFKKENEEVVDLLKEQYLFKLVKTELIKGYDQKADTMYAALLMKPA